MISGCLARRGAVTGAMLMSLTAVARAQDPRLAARLDSTTARTVQAQVDSARLDGLPTEPLVDLALEGASKRAQPQRIVAAVIRARGQLAEARAALGRSSTTEEIVSGAYALRLGATGDGLRQLRARRPDKSLGLPLATFLDLMARGVAPDTAEAVLLQLTGAGVEDSQYRRLLRELDRVLQDDALGTPSAATIRIGRALAGGPER